MARYEPVYALDDVRGARKGVPRKSQRCEAETAAPPNEMA